LIEQPERGFPRVNYVRVVLNSFFVDKFRRPVAHRSGVKPSLRATNSKKSDRAAFGSNLHNDFFIRHLGYEASIAAI
jgi:hypothetical protein